MKRLLGSALVCAAFAGSSCDGRLDFESNTGGSAGTGQWIDIASWGGAAAAFITCVDQCGKYRLACSPLTNTCVECWERASCDFAVQDDRQTCSYDLRNRCVRCVEDYQCPDRYECTDAHVCAPRCDDDHDCESLGPNAWCNSQRDICERCREGDCASTPNTPYCRGAGVGCVACLNDSHCANSTRKVCDPVLNECVECADSRNCMPGQQCDPRTHTCRSNPVQ
ncbi:MAG: hypothetical protein ACOY0T_07550 [Myxococcota bacterium]